MKIIRNVNTEESIQCLVDNFKETLFYESINKFLLVKVMSEDGFMAFQSQVAQLCSQIYAMALTAIVGDKKEEMLEVSSDFNQTCKNIISIVDDMMKEREESKCENQHKEGVH
jgi:hypothetical protein